MNRRSHRIRRRPPPAHSNRRRLILECLEHRRLLASDFTVALMPDTQHYAESFPATFTAQTQWLANQVATGDVDFVTHVGDVVDTASDINQWINADAAIDLLDGDLTGDPDGRVPYSIVPGNHDYEPTNSHGPLTQFNNYFGPQRYAGRTWHGGASADGANYFQVLQLGGFEILHLGLEWEPRPSSVAWSQSVLDAHRDLPTIVTTHAYLDDQGGRFVGATTGDGLDGEQIFQTLIRPNSQVFMVLSGHFSGEHQQISLNDAGLEVHELMADYQNRPNGGNGWLQLLEFRPDLDTVDVTTYSPTLDQFETDADSQFTLSIDFDQRFQIDAAPVGQWGAPLDNNAEDLDPTLYSVTTNQAQPDIQIQLRDAQTGVNDDTVTAAAVTLLRDNVVQTEGVNYQFHYNSAADRISLTPLGMPFDDGQYEIQLSGGSTIADNDGNGMLATSLHLRIDTSAVSSPNTFHFALRDPATIGGLAVDNEDVVTFDGSEFELLFDGSDVGLAAFAIDAMSLIDDNDLLLSFTTSGMIPGIPTAVDDSDIVRFTPTQLGGSTTGTFSLYFDASDVELTTGDEDTDGVSLLADGRILISTRGPYAVGALTGDDEDVLAFTPTQLGDDTAGTWEIYFDGEDVGLAGEDVNAVSAYPNGNLYLSLADAFTLPEMNVRDEDVFHFVPTSLGDTTTGAFPAPAFFDGSSVNLDGDIFGLHVPVPEVTPVNLAIDTGPLGAGVAARDLATGGGFLMYSQQPVSQRFDVLAGVSEHFVPVQLMNGKWHYDNNDRLVAFAPVSTDLLVATVDFTNDTVTSLQGTVGEINGIQSGFADGDLVFMANQFGGNANSGEFTVLGTQFRRRLPRELATYDAGNLGAGIAARDGATGQGFLLYSKQSLQQRWGGLIGGVSQHFIPAVSLPNGWHYDNNGALVAFTPEPTDLLVATIDFDLDVVTSLEGVFSSHNGIASGYIDGDLQFFADQFGGVFNEGEFEVTGTHFRQLTHVVQHDIGPLGGGIAAHDTAKGNAYLLYSVESVFTRFSDTPPVAGNSAHLIVATHSAGQWYYDDNGASRPFVPRNTDLILADINYGADAIEPLLGRLGQRFGIDAGYVDGDLMFFADRWGNSYNEGEFQVQGSYFRTAGAPSLTVTVDVGELGDGVPARDNATGDGFLMYSQQPLSQRFVVLGGVSEHFVPVLHITDQWYFDDNNQLTPFTPDPSDLLVASVNFTTDQVVSLQDTAGLHYGIETGFVGGDLVFQANMYAGAPNQGEFTVLGSQFERRVQSEQVVSTSAGVLGSGVVVHNSASGNGFLMYSQQNVKNRFVGLPLDVSEHFVAVVYTQGMWHVDNDTTLIPFTPVASDLLIASVDFNTSTATTLKGVLGSHQGIQSGYLDGDLLFIPNQFGGMVSLGDFQVFGTFFTR